MKFVLATKPETKKTLAHRDSGGYERTFLFPFLGEHSDAIRSDYKERGWKVRQFRRQVRVAGYTADVYALVCTRFADG